METFFVRVGRYLVIALVFVVATIIVAAVLKVRSPASEEKELLSEPSKSWAGEH